MFIELVETLRCVRQHDESWLVASIDELADRSIRRGTLGCPVCGTQYPIVDGVADFSGGADPPAASAPIGLDDEEIAVRAGAFLSLGDRSGVVVLGGEWARGAADLTRSLDVRVIAVNAPPEVEETSSVALARILDVIPLAARSCAGVALDGSFGAGVLLSAQKVVRPGSRIVAARSASHPSDLAIIASDENWWIGETAPEITPLRRGNR